MDYIEKVKSLYATEEANCGIKVGTVVRVKCKVASCSYGWNATWNASMDNYVHAVGKVLSILPDNRGMRVQFFNIDTWNFPFFALEKVVPESPRVNFAAFTKVLVRNCRESRWQPAFFTRYDDTNYDFPYYTIGDAWKYCILYEGNEHLVNTTRDLD